MSSIVNKVKDALHSDKDKTTHHEGTHSSTHPTGTHTTTSTAEPRIHSTHDTTTTGGIGGATGTHNTVGGTDNYTYGTGANRGASGPASKTDGPHNSNLMNKADPRVDSDRDHSKNMGMNPQGSATTGTGAGAVKDHPGHTVRGDEAGFAGTTTGTGIGGAQHHSGVAGTTGSSTFGNTGLNRGPGGPATHTDGPHNSNLMNKTDPRVDSDRDHSRNMGVNPHGTASTGMTGTTGTGTGDNAAFFTSGATGATGVNRGVDGPATRTDGPHNSNLLNKTDPRVDSDRDHSRNMGANPHGTATTGTTGTTGMTGMTGTSGTHGTHTGTHGAAVGTTGIAGSHGTHTGTHGTHTGTTGTTGTHGTHNTLAGATGSGPGPAPNTAGPHKSDMMNKVDPRVDSNLDGSKTVGGDKTYAQP